MYFDLSSEYKEQVYKRKPYQNMHSLIQNFERKNIKYLDSKRKAKKQIAEDIRQSALNVPQQIPQLKKPLNRQFSQSKKDPKEAKEISIFKLFEQIKEL